MTAAPISPAVELVLECADSREARRISTLLLKRRLIATSSIVPIDHGSRWIDGEFHTAPVTLILVTRPDNAVFVTDRIQMLLQKMVPISVTPVGQLRGSTIEWVDTAKSVRAAEKGK